MSLVRKVVPELGPGMIVVKGLEDEILNLYRRDRSLETSTPRLEIYLPSGMATLILR